MLRILSHQSRLLDDAVASQARVDATIRGRACVVHGDSLPIGVAQDAMGQWTGRTGGRQLGIDPPKWAQKCTDPARHVRTWGRAPKR